MPDYRLTEHGGWVDQVTVHRVPSSKCGTGMAVPSGVMGVVMHTMVGWLDGTDSMFTGSGGPQSSAHFGVGQDGRIIQWVNIRGGVAWHAAGGNANWYGIEHEDGGNPKNPLTEAAMNASARIVELLSRDSVGRFKLQVSDSVNTEGYGVHYMGGRAWSPDLHTCPDSVPGQGPRSKQRAEIIKRAQSLRATGQFTSTAPAAPAAEEEDMATSHLPQTLNESVTIPWAPGSVKGFALLTDPEGPVTFAYWELHRDPSRRWVKKADLKVATELTHDVDNPKDCAGITLKLYDAAGRTEIGATGFRTYT